MRRTSHPLGRPLLLGSALLTSGCVADDAGMPPAAVVRDSAGVTVVETSGAAAERAVGWTIGGDPGLAIGVAEGAPEHQLFRVNASRSSPMGASSS